MAIANLSRCPVLTDKPPASPELTISRPQRVRQGDSTSVIASSTCLVYPLAVGNVAVAAMNLAADLGFPRVTADVVRRV